MRAKWITLALVVVALVARGADYTQAGTIELGGAFAIANQKQGPYNRLTILEVSPEFAYFYAPHLFVGPVLNYTAYLFKEREVRQGMATSYYSDEHDLSVGAKAGWNITERGPLVPFLSLAIQYDRQVFRETATREGWDTGLFFITAFGAKAKIAKRVAILVQPEIAFEVRDGALSQDFAIKSGILAILGK